MSSLAFPSTEPDSGSHPSHPTLTTSSPARPAPKPYATHSSRAFSRSAQKRQSVMALPSIAHLQHGFARLSLQQQQGESKGKPRSVAEMVGGPLSVEEATAARRRARERRSFIAGQGELQEEPEEEGEEVLLGPEPDKPQRDTRMPWEKDGLEGGTAVKGEKELRREVLDALEAVCERWNLLAYLPSSRRLSRSSTASPSASRCASPLPPSTSSSSRFLSPSLSSRAMSPSPSVFSDDGDGDGDATVVSDGGTTASTAVDAPEDALLPPVLDLLTTTTSAIRAVQRYVVALPASTFSSSSSSSSASPSSSPPTPTPTALSFAPATTTVPVLGTSDAHNRDDYLRLSTAAHPRPRASLALPSSVSSAPNKASTGTGTTAAGGGEKPAVLGELRRASLEVLGALREIEGRYRLAPPVLSSSSSSALAEDAKDGKNPVEPPPEYAPDVALDAVLDAFSAAEEGVKKWVEVVGRVLGRAGRARAGRGRGRRSRLSGGSEGKGEEEDEAETEGSDGSEGGEEGEVPLWAEKDAFGGDDLARAHALLASHLPFLPPPLNTLSLPSPCPSSSANNPHALLTLLASAPHLLCHSYNAVLRHSARRGFGFIPAASIHELEVPLETEDGAGGAAMGRQASTASEGGAAEGHGKARVGGTFRRVENLRVWAGALMFRYALPLHLPPSSSTSYTSTSTSTSSSAPSPAPPIAPPSGSILFDPRAVALRAEGSGWEEMLERVLGAWARRVGGEWREERDEEEGVGGL
ncbi:hypothetical protein JCM6882_002276 [Rhodosporidiobolus microsporus]